MIWIDVYRYGSTWTDSYAGISDVTYDVPNGGVAFTVENRRITTNLPYKITEIIAAVTEEITG
jgi:hypothetical protein